MQACVMSWNGHVQNLPMYLLAYIPNGLKNEHHTAGDRNRIYDIRFGVCCGLVKFIHIFYIGSKKLW